MYLQYRTGKGVVIGGTSNSFINLRGDFYIGGKQVLTADRALKNIASADIEGYIKAGGHGDFGSLRIAGTEVLDASRNLKNVSSADLGSLRIGGTEVITSDRVLKSLDRLDLMGAYLARPMLQPLGNLVFAETFDRYTDPSELDINWDVVTRSSNITFEPGFGGLGQSLRSQDTVGKGPSAH